MTMACACASSATCRPFSASRCRRHAASGGTDRRQQPAHDAEYRCQLRRTLGHHPGGAPACASVRTMASLRAERRRRSRFRPLRCARPTSRLPISSSAPVATCDQQFPAVAARLRRAVLHRHACGPTSTQACAAPRHRGLRPPRAPLRQTGEQSPRAGLTESACCQRAPDRPGACAARDRRASCCCRPPRSGSGHRRRSFLLALWESTRQRPRHSGSRSAVAGRGRRRSGRAVVAARRPSRRGFRWCWWPAWRGGCWRSHGGATSPSPRADQRRNRAPAAGRPARGRVPRGPRSSSIHDRRIRWPLLALLAPCCWCGRPTSAPIFADARFGTRASWRRGVSPARPGKVCAARRRVGGGRGRRRVAGSLSRAVAVFCCRGLAAVAAGVRSSATCSKAC